METEVTSQGSGSESEPGPPRLQEEDVGGTYLTTGPPGLRRCSLSSHAVFGAQHHDSAGDGVTQEFFTAVCICICTRNGASQGSPFRVSEGHGACVLTKGVL
ncbi:hypothetical protein DIPPA_24928 [Diplonema papillatum]|nr:hypothetical protein DIPPA_24928 [Diplonema papillatum]